MMDRHETIEKHFATTLPEDQLVALAYRGIDVPASPTVEDYSKLVSSLKGRKSLILFKWFWTHTDVATFCKSLARQLSVDDICWYLRSLYDRTHTRQPMHWIERVNLFHAFGLSRLVEGTDTKYEIEGRYGYGDYSKTIDTLCDLSACNVLAMLHGYDTAKSKKMLEVLEENPRVLWYFAKYQVYYYGGLQSLFSILQRYLTSDKQVVVPQTLAALLFAKRDIAGLSAPETEEYLRDELLGALPKSLLKVVERIGQRGEDQANR